VDSSELSRLLGEWEEPEVYQKIGVSDFARLACALLSVSPF
jgi:hypothetical protein